MLFFFLKLNLLFKNASILSEYLHTAQNEATTPAASKSHIVIPHQVLKGINCNENDVVKTEIALVIIIIIIKYSQVMDESPATKQRISSGNNGSRNISESKR